MNTERRILLGTNGIKIEKRSDGVTVCSGYSSVFYDGTSDTEYQLYPGMKERVLAGAYDRCLRERQDVRALYNHDPNLLLGRVSSGTLRLSIDKRGLRYEVDLPDTQYARDMAEMIRRGDLTGSSFSFSPVQQRFQYSQDDADDIRELVDLDVQDVSPTPFPAYTGTTTSIRAIGDEAELRCACDVEARGVVRFQAHDLIDDDNWDHDAALSRVKAWASEGDRMSMRKFSRAFAWHDGSGSAEGHRGLHHDVQGGKLMTHKGAVDRCMRALGGEDGDGVPEDDRAAVRSHLERHRSWDDPDEEDDKDEDDFDNQRQRRFAEMRRRLQIAEAE